MDSPLKHHLVVLEERPWKHKTGPVIHDHAISKLLSRYQPEVFDFHELTQHGLIRVQKCSQWISIAKIHYLVHHFVTYLFEVLLSLVIINHPDRDFLLISECLL